jgi:hypothetical protein
MAASKMTGVFEAAEQVQKVSVERLPVSGSGSAAALLTPRPARSPAVRLLVI